MDVLSSRGRYILIAALTIFAALVWYIVFYFESHAGVMVTFFDVGQGDAIFIETASKTQVLIDGGPDGTILSKLGSTLPFWDRSIDVLVLSHPHADHLDGLYEILKRYDIGMVIESGASYATPQYAAWHALLKEKKIKTIIPVSGDRIYLGSEAMLDILLPARNFEGNTLANVHDAMVISRLHRGASSLLLTGDAEKSLEFQLMDLSGYHPFFSIDADILKVGHHGSKTSSTEGFLRAVSPRYAVISAGRNNRYGHPHEAVIERMKKLGIDILRTDESGDVQIIFHGDSFEIAE